MHLNLSFQQLHLAWKLSESSSKYQPLKTVIRVYLEHSVQLSIPCLTWYFAETRETSTMHLLWATSFIRDFKLYDLKYHLDMRCCYQGYYAAIPSTKAQRQGKGWNNHTYIWSNSPVAGYVNGHNFCSLWRGMIINNWSKFGRSSVQGCLHLWTSSSKCPTQAISSYIKISGSGTQIQM